MALGMKQLMQLIQADPGGKEYTAAYEAAAKNKHAKLESLLKGNQDASKRNAEEQQLMRMTGTDNIKDAVEAFRSKGQSVHIGDLSVGATPTDPAAKMAAGNDKANTQAYSQAMQVYNRQLPKYQAAMQKITEGMSAVNDPKQTGSVGAAKSLLISGVAEMNRYNQQEGSDLVPSTFLNKVTQFTNSLGNDANPMSDAQRRSINSLFTEGLKGLKAKHDITKAAAIQTYSMNPHADANRTGVLQDQLGKPFGSALDESMKQYETIPTTQNTAQPAPAAAAPSSMADKLRSFFGGGSTAQPTPEVTGGLNANEQNELNQLRAKHKPGQ